MNRRHLACLLVATLVPALVHAQGMDLAGVTYPPTAAVGGTTLQLNGAGIRYKFVKVYTAGLYLTGKATTTDAVLAAAGPKRMHVVMLRDIDANELGKLFTRGMQDNTEKAEFLRMIPGTLRMSDIFSAQKKLVAGDAFSVDWVPGTGTVILVNGKATGQPIAEPEFYSGLMRIWLGKSPAEATLKAALLGRPQASGGN
jgi:Chalcone isomerase-like